MIFVQIRKPRLREVKQPTEGHRGKKEQSCVWLLNPKTKKMRLEEVPKLW